MQLVVVTRDAAGQVAYGGMREIGARYAHASSKGHTVIPVGFSARPSSGGKASGPVAGGDRQVADLPRRGRLGTIAQVARGVPIQVALRTPLDPALNRLVASLRDRLDPSKATAVVAEQFLTLPVAATVADELDVALVHRTHNDELCYARYVASSERRPTHHAVLAAEARLVGRFVRRWSGDPRLALVLHIAEESRHAWLAASRWGIGFDQLVVPPALPARTVDPSPTEGPLRCVYIGSLDLPQNAMELRRFLAEGWLPFVASAEARPGGAGEQRLRRPPVLRIAGRGAAAFAATLGELTPPAVEVRSDFAEPGDVLSCCDVAVNPAIGGSGVSIKTVEYLAHGLPVVTRPAGLRGLSIPTELTYTGSCWRTMLAQAFADQADLAQRRLAVRRWYDAHLTPEAVLPLVWERIEEAALAHRMVHQ